MQKKLNTTQSTSCTQISDQLVDWEIDLNTGLIHCSPNLMDRAGSLLSERTFSIDWLLERIHPQDLVQVSALTKKYLQQPTCPQSLTFRLQRKTREQGETQQYLSIICHGTLTHQGSKKIQGVVIFLKKDKQSDHTFNRFLRLERLVMTLSQKFLTVKHSQIDEVLNTSLKQLKEGMGANCSCLMYCGNKNTSTPSNIYGCGENGFLKERLNETLKSLDFDHINSLFSTKSTVFLPNNSLSNTHLQQQLLSAMSVPCAIALPLQGERLGRGCLLLGFNGSIESWRQEDISLIRSIADIFFITLDRQSVKVELQAKQEQLLESQAVAKIGSWTLDNSSEFLKCSPEVFKIFELEEAQDINFEFFLTFVHPDDRQNAAEIIGQSIEEQGPYNFVYRIYSTAGTLKYVQGRGKAVLDHNGKLLRRIGSVLDVTEHKQAEERNRLAAIMFESTQEGSLITDKDTNIIAVNKAFSAITGYSEEDALGNRPTLLSSGLQSKEFYERMKNSLEKTGSWEGEICNKRKNGEIYPEWLSIKNVFDENDEIINRIAVFSDISHLKNTEKQIEQLSHTDQLTGLPNRLLFHSRLTHSIEIAKRNKYRLAVMYIDLDHFKNVNDSLGHSIGDDVLLMVAERLRKRVRDSDTLARIGGDEFVLLLEQVDEVGHVASVAQSILELMAEPFEFVDGKTIFLGVSIGVSFYPTDGISATELISHADAAVTQVKDNGRNGVHFYTLELTEVAQAKMKLESELRRALVNKSELQLYYQPQVDMTDGRIVGAEALLRWHHPIDGIISPMLFLPVAERSGLMASIDYWVLETACLQQASWRASDLSPFILAINITKYSFMDVSFLSRLNEIIESTGVDPKTIELEITEGALIEPSPLVIQTIAELKRKGFTLAIDDFGTGYSSLAYLQRFNVDKLKIDRSFVKDVLTDTQGEAITSAIILMAKSLNLKILAEGVENNEQLAILKAKGCEVYQGFYFSKPVPVKDFEALVRAQISCQSC
jgi:diguanylate cyclase (GGDEF)-like protein/PAS domain S-box-containing protein